MRLLLLRLIQKKFLIATACILWLIIIITLSVIPYHLGNQLTGTDTTFRWDYLEHFGGYFLLAVLAGLWLADRRNLRLKLTAVILIITTGFAISYILEYIQLYVPGRAYNLVDAAYNAAGLLAGTLFVSLVVLPVLQRRFLTPGK